MPGIQLMGELKAVFDYVYITKEFKPKKQDWNLFSAVEPKYYPLYPLVPTPFFNALRIGFEYGLSVIRMSFIPGKIFIIYADRIPFFDSLCFIESG